MGISYLLNPKYALIPMYKDSEFDDYSDSVNQMKAYIKEFYKDQPLKVPLCLNEFGKYCCQYDYLTEEKLEEYRSEDPRSYWSTEGKSKFPLLAVIASRLFLIPASNCASERNWKCFSSIHTKKRNRLTVEKCQKLVFVCVNSFLLDEEDKIDYFSIEE